MEVSAKDGTNVIESIDELLLQTWPKRSKKRGMSKALKVSTFVDSIESL
jgi:hypothetical protein